MTAWRLSQRWTTCRLQVLDDAGHGGGNNFVPAVIGALNKVRVLVRTCRSGAIALGDTFPAVLLQHLQGADDQRIDAVADIGPPIAQRDVDRDAFALVADHIGGKVLLIRQAVAPAIGELLLKLIREYAVGVIADDRDIRQLLECQGKDLAAAEYRIAGQEDDRPGELGITLRFDVPGPQSRIVIVAWADLRLPMERDTLAVTKPIDDGDCGTVIAAGIVADIDDDAVELVEVISDPVHGSNQSSLLDPFQLENPEITEGP